MSGLGAHLALAVALLASVAARAEIPLDQRKSGADFMSAATRAMQEDDTANPAMLSTLDGESLWSEKAGPERKSCADCHGPAPQSMKGVAARYPAYDARRGAPIDVAGRINACRTVEQKAEAFKAESQQLLALGAYVGLQSRGMPVSPPDDQRLAPYRARGEALWNERIGQLNFSCAQCHDDNWGKRLGSAAIPQAHPNAYPIYRLDWQGMGSLQRRFRNCMSGVRAEAFPYGAQEFIDLELFLMQRARGMPMETPGVRP
ncbi:MAG: sulfur oxidation c-type cytochrome SoxA [Beijerinckiaceae bacterium]